MFFDTSIQAALGYVILDQCGARPTFFPENKLLGLVKDIFDWEWSRYNLMFKHYDIHNKLYAQKKNQLQIDNKA